ncbi:uncharacterized protein LOC144450935 [Glandiceps talaboti]
MEVWVKAIAVLALLVVLLIVTLLPLSFGYIDYYEYGFRKQRSTGKVYTDRVYTQGRHFIGVDYTFVKFPSTTQTVLISNLTVFTEDQEEVNLTFTVHYTLWEYDLNLLYEAYSTNYETVMVLRSKQAVKRISLTRSSTDFVEQRELVETNLFNEVRNEISGSCCEKGCEETVRGCRPIGCRRYEFCNEGDKGIYISVKSVDLLLVVPSSTLQSVYLTQAMSEVRVKTKRYEQDSAVIKKETELKVTDILNEAEEIMSSSNAEAFLIREQAEADARAKTDTAHNTGIDNVFQTLSIVNVEHKTSFIYLRTLRYMKNVYLSVNFDQLTMSTNVAMVPNEKSNSEVTNEQTNKQQY